MNTGNTVKLLPQQLLGRLTEEAPSQEAVKRGTNAVAEGRWYTAYELDDGLVYHIPQGMLAEVDYLWLDLYFEGPHMAKHTFAIYLRQGADDPGFYATYGVIPCCSARFRLPLEATALNRLWLDREGALIKPAARGSRVTLSQVDRVEIRINRIGPGVRPLHWCQSPLFAGPQPPAIDQPVLPFGALVDEFGQSTRLDRAGKVDSIEQLRDRLQHQYREAPNMRWPDTFGRWGGRTAGPANEASGFFGLQRDERRWWFVDPDGLPFWSTGMCTVRLGSTSSPLQRLESAYAWLPGQKEFAEAYSSDPQVAATKTIEFLTVNLKRVFGERWKQAWETIVYGMLRRWGINTVANGSDWQAARRMGIPFTRMLDLFWATTPLVFRDFPDVYAPCFEDDVQKVARQLEETAEEPALLGYFLENEPKWSFAEQSPAEGMLMSTERAHTRDALVEWLKQRYDSEEALREAWGPQASFAAVSFGRWSPNFSEQAKDDLREFSRVMVDRLYRTLSSRCRDIDPNHLNLGARFPGIPAALVLEGMRHVDVLSINLYKRDLRVSPIVDELRELSKKVDKPLIIGEFHFGGLDGGVPGIANQNVSTQADRAAAFRVYQESATALPFCVGAHYHKLQDNPPLGRPDGENYNVGFYDITLFPHEPLGSTARDVHTDLYDIASGLAAPAAEPPEYLGI
ncbi:MAG: hypothetical protein EA383_08220 [Spirochaetaceae bacterium]|nr:MAG: hypothetical protein EA383_08220 [Spirochaetaceae bacterium]